MTCATLGAFQTELNKVLLGGANAGDSVDLHLTGTLYKEIGIRNYNCTDAGTGLRIYGNADGTTVVQFSGTTSPLVSPTGMTEANSACFRLGSASGLRETNTRIEVYNIDFDGNGTLGTTNGCTWGVIVGGAYDGDPNRGNCFEVHFQGCRVRDTGQSGCKTDGNGGTDGVTWQQCTITTTGLRYTSGDSSGFGEGMYVGDGNTGRAWSNITIDRCEISAVLMGEGVEMKRNGGNGLITDCHIHDITMDNGGGIKFEDNPNEYTARRNRVHDIKTNADSDDSASNGICMTGGGILENNIVWDIESGGGCVMMPHAIASGLTGSSTHNTFDATGAGAAFRFTGDFGDPANRTNDWAFTSTDDIVIGTVTSGSVHAGSSTGSTVTATFVGPTSGTADAGTGHGSGFEVSSGAARNAVTPIGTVTLDIQGYTRIDPTDAGAIDADAVGPSTETFETTNPADGATAVTTPITPSGTAPNDGATVYQHRIYNVTTASEVVAFDAVGTTFTAGAETWTADASSAIPQTGAVLRIEARRWP